MSKVVMSLPKGMVKNSVVGGLLALAVYVAMQFFYEPRRPGRPSW